MHEFAVYSTEPETHFRVIPNKKTSIEHRNLNSLIRERIKCEKRFFGIEISPSPTGRNLDYNCFGDHQPLFTSITWLFDHNINCEPISKSPAITLTRSVHECNPALLHLTCYKLSNSKLQEIIDNGVTNFFALRGDLECAEQPWKFAIDLVKAIRQMKCDATICVAGYPEVHRTAKSANEDLKNLKAKVDAGADFIITNTCFNINQLFGFIRSCRSIGIIVPIIPGVYVPSSFAELTQMCRICNVIVPATQMEIFQRYQHDNELFGKFAIENATEFIGKLFEFDFERIPGIHFFTLNKYEQIVKVVQKCDFINQ